MTFSRKATGSCIKTFGYEIVVLFVFLIFVLMRLSTSSWSYISDFFGLENSGLILGSPQAVKGDEWESATASLVARTLYPDVKPFFNPSLPFLSDSLPHHNWRIIFQPFSLFYLLDPAIGYSFFFASMFAISLLLWPIFLQKIGLRRNIALVGAIIISFSEFVSHWFTHFPAVFTFIPVWGIFVFSKVHSKWKLFLSNLLLIWLTIVYWETTFYPPFTICIVLFMMVCFLQFRKLAASTRVLFGYLGSIIIGTLFYFATNLSYWSNYSDTRYPGRRFVESGGLNPFTELSQIFPLSIIKSISVSNELEAATFCSLFIFFAPVLFGKNSLRLFIIKFKYIFLALAFIFIYQSLPKLTYLGLIFGLHLVPSNRSLLFSGLLLTVISLFAVQEGDILIFNYRFFLLSFILVSGLLLLSSKNQSLISQAMNSKYQLFLPIALIIFSIIGAFLVNFILFREISIQNRNLIALFILHLPLLVSFLLWNPIQSSSAIFNKINSKSIQAIQNIADSSESGVLAIPGYPGRLLWAAGFRSVSDRPDLPDLPSLKNLYPHMDQNKFDYIFNRTATILINPNQLATKPELTQGKENEIFLPQADFKDKFSTLSFIKLRKSDSSLQLGNVDPENSIDSIERLGLKCTITGWANIPDIGTSTWVIYSNKLRVERIERIRRPDVINSHFGFGLYSGIRITFRATSLEDFRTSIGLLLPSGRNVNWNLNPCI